MYRSLVAALRVLPAAMAYKYSTDSSSSTAATSDDSVHVVKVGKDGLTFDPSEVTASVGDTVEFHFWPEAHSIAQSSFDEPCQPLSNGSSAGFFSGAVPVDSGEADEVFTITIEDDGPMWYYCATGSHCQAGMVGVINPPESGNSLEMYASAAAEASDNVEPSETGGGTLAVATSTSTDEPDAGVVMRGGVSWGLMVSGVAVAGCMGLGAILV